MSRQASPTLIGAFVFGALCLALATVLLVAGGTFLQERRRHVIYFEGAAQGLQVGAPVMFLGVKVGRVTMIQLGLDDRQRFLVPVTIEIEPNTVRARNGETIDLREHATMRRLVDQGLRGRLRMQSLLTGQLYVDLDFHPDRPARFVSLNPSENEIPAIPTPVQDITSRLESFQADLFLADMVAIGSSLKTMLASPATLGIPEHLTAALTGMESLAVRLEALATRLDQETRPTFQVLNEDLAELRQTLAATRSAMDRVSAAADTVGALAAPEGKFLAQWARATEEIRVAAQALAGLSGGESLPVARLDDALKEIAKAARALRTLADTLEQRPETLLRGRPERETSP